MDVRVTLATSRVGSREEFSIPVDDEDLEGMTEMERDTYIGALVNEAVWDRGFVTWETS